MGSKALQLVNFAIFSMHLFLRKCVKMPYSPCSWLQDLLSCVLRWGVVAGSHDSLKHSGFMSDVHLNFVVTLVC